MSEHFQSSGVLPEGSEAAYPERKFRKTRFPPVETVDYLAEVHGLKIAESTLAKWRCLKSDGPEFRKAGRSVYYDRTALDAWVARRLGEPLCSTSAGGAR